MRIGSSWFLLFCDSNDEIFKMFDLRLIAGGSIIHVDQSDLAPAIKQLQW